jgi:hypothetical protein
MQASFNQGARRSFSLCAGNMNCPKLFLWIVQPVQQITEGRNIDLHRAAVSPLPID